MTTQGYKGTVNNASERFCRISLQLTNNQLEWKWCTLRYAHFVWTGWIVVAGKRSCIYCTWLAKKKNSRDPSEQNKMYSIDKMFFWNKKKRLRCDMILDTWIFLYLSGHRFYQLITYPVHKTIHQNQFNKYPPCMDDEKHFYNKDKIL